MNTTTSNLDSSWLGFHQDLSLLIEYEIIIEEYTLLHLRCDKHKNFAISDTPNVHSTSYSRRNHTLIPKGILLLSPYEPYSYSRINHTLVPVGTILLSPTEQSISYSRGNTNLVPVGTILLVPKEPYSCPQRNHTLIPKGIYISCPRGTILFSLRRNIYLLSPKEPLSLYLYLCYITHHITFFLWTIYNFLSLRDLLILILNPILNPNLVWSSPSSTEKKYHMTKW